MAEETPRLEIFGDSPTTEDKLGFNDYADILLGMVGDFDAKSPLTIGIHGRWGSGKTSLMKMLEEKFGGHEDVKTIWFNAWAYGDEPIGLALLQQILNEFQEKWKCKKPVKNLLKGTGRLFADAALRKSTGISYKDAKDHFKRSIEIKSTLRRDFEDLIGKCLQDRERLVVFIDDLDRCLPEKTIEILEVIKLFLDVPKCIFVIGVEKEVIEKGIEVRYKSKEQKIPISGQDYIEKIIQIPFTLPPIQPDDIADFIKNLGIEDGEEGYVKIVAKGTSYNPRKVKLFLNVLRIRRAIAERTGGEIKPDLSAKLFVFEYVFQEFYKDVVKYKDQDLLCKLERLAKGDSDEELEEELEKSPFLKGYHENEDLSSLVRDEPLFCGIDIEPYIYLSGTEAFHEVAASDESTQDELLSGDYMKMKRAADAINKMPDSEKQRCLNVVMLKLKDGGTANVRRNAAKAIGAIGDAGAVEALIGVLEDRGEDANLRRNAASALGAIGDAGAVAALIGVLDDEDVDVCRNAASALGAIGDAGAVEALIGVLADMGKAANVRRNAAKALGAIGDAGAVAALIKALGDKNANVRRNAARALGRIGDPIAVPALEKVLKDRADDADLCVWVTEALEEIKVKQNQ